jgi:hypothetical protein
LERTLRLAVPNDGVLSRFISKKYATRLALRKERDVLAKPKQGEVKRKALQLILPKSSL